MVAGAAIAALIVSVAIAVVSPGPADPELGLVLLACALASRLITTDVAGRQFISAAFLSGALAAGLLGPAWALAIPVGQELLGWLVERYRRIMLAINAGLAALPTVIAALVLQALAYDRSSVAFFIALAVASFLIIAFNAEAVALAIALVDGGDWRAALRPAVHLVPAVVLNIGLVTATAAVYVQTGYAVLILILVAVLAFGYMARLVNTARERTRE
jgi:hypothetical protein